VSRDGLTPTTPSGPPAGVAPAGQSEAPPLPPDEFQKLLVPFGVPSGPSEAVEFRIDEPASDEASVIREVAATLVDVLRADQDEGEVRDTAGALEGYLPWLVDHHEFKLLLKILAGVKAVAAGGAGGHGERAGSFLKSIAGEPLIERLLEALWSSRETELEPEILACLEMFADHLIAPLMRVLSVETRAGMRAMLCDIIVDVGRDRVDEVGAFITDGRWYLVRNAANILGRLGGPRAVAYLARLAEHPEYRVRREAIDALQRSGAAEAGVHLAGFLDDPDENLQIRVLQSLTDDQVRLALPKLLAVLERRDPWHRHFIVKRQVIAALARARTRGAFPVLRRLAGRRFILDRRGRELRSLARFALASLDGQESSRRQGAFAAGSGEANR
jgi:hypothetical protein